jgi:hypothetical protein
VYSDFFKILLPTLRFEKTEEIDNSDQIRHKKVNVITETAIGTCITTTKVKTQPAQPADEKHRWKGERHANERRLKKTTCRNDGLRNKPEERRSE